MVVLGLFVIELQRRGLATAEKELEAAVVDEAALSVIGTLDQAASVSSRAAAIFADETLEVDARTRLLQDLASRSGGVLDGISFFDEQRNFVDAIVPAAPAGIATASVALREPPSASAKTSSSYRVLPSPSRAMRYEAPLVGAVHGFLVVGISRQALEARLEDLSRDRFGANDRIYLVDESLHVIAGATAASAKLPIFEAAGFSSATGFSTTTPMVLTTELVDDGIPKVGTIRTMPHQRWALVVERPTSEAFAALATTRKAFLGLLITFALGAAVIGLLIVRRVVGPIHALMQLVGRYARRELDARSTVKSGDELESLGSSLEHMADSLAKSETEIDRRARIETNLRRYMPAEAAEAASRDDASSSAALDLGGAKKRVTVVFADVVAFTGFAERASPEDAVAFLNELFTILSEIVFRHGGMVDKFIGDCIMAVFRPSKDGAGDDKDDVARALEAAEDMHAFVASNLPRWREAYAFDVELGIGVSTGEVLLGNLGSSARMEYTVIGDAVNVAARLEALAGPRQTLTTREVVDACPDLSFSSLGEHALRGKAKAVEVFEVVS